VTKRSPAEELFKKTARRKSKLETVMDEQEEKESEAVEALKKAMTSKDVAELEAAVKQADAVGLKMSESQDARRMIVQERGGGLLWINHVGRRSFEVEWEKGDTVSDLKKVIFKVAKVPYGMQVLKAGGADLGDDYKALEKLSAIRGGKSIDIWLYDNRDKEDIIADEMEGEPFYTDDNVEEEEVAAGSLLSVFLGVVPLLYVGTQILGINPFEPEQAGKLIDLGELLGFTEAGQGMDVAVPDKRADEVLESLEEVKSKLPSKIPLPSIVENKNSAVTSYVQDQIDQFNETMSVKK